MSQPVVVRTVSGARYTQEVRVRDHAWQADEPTAHGGADHGPTPYELLLAAVGT